MMKLILLGAPVLLAMSAPVLAQAMAAADYVMTAGAGDLYERQSSQIILETTKNPNIKGVCHDDSCRSWQDHRRCEGAGSAIEGRRLAAETHTGAGRTDCRTALRAWSGA